MKYLIIILICSCSLEFETKTKQTIKEIEKCDTVYISLEKDSLSILLKKQAYLQKKRDSLYGEYYEIKKYLKKHGLK